MSEIPGIPAAISRGSIPVIGIPGDAEVFPGRVSPSAGALAGRSLERALHMCLRGEADGLVTSPVSKQAMTAGGYRSPGQTEIISARAGVKKFMMILVSGSFRVGLATVHIPLRKVSQALTIAGILEKLTTLSAALRRDFGIVRPRIALLGLNPHAGENGLIGEEERRVLGPAVRRARRGIRVDGPFPADGFFGSRAHLDYDGVLAMYHDQGLIPLKMQGFETGVNYTAGLPIVRTSPDHGTAFDIAGKGRADSGSMSSAVKLAVSIIHQRLRRG